MVIFLYKDAETRLDKGVFFSADQRFPLCERGRKKNFYAHFRWNLSYFI